MVESPPPQGAARIGKHQPFPGLSPFDIGEADWFFGRGRETFDILNRLRELRFIAVVGPSGCGKSSLVKAGVLATLERHYLGGNWRMVPVRPADGPMRNLIRGLKAAFPGSDSLESDLRAGELGLVGIVQEARLAPDTKLLVLVDQFEELFQFVRRAEQRSDSSRRRGDSSAEDLAAGSKAQEEAKAFLKLLLTAALSDVVPVYIVITMRSEWLGHCAAYGELAEAINEGLYLVPEMGRPELRKAIVQPILQAEAEIVSPLVDRMLNDLDGRTDQLPVLQHALMRMWRRRTPGAPLGPEDYNAVGGFARCLSDHAGQLYTDLSKEQKQIAETLFKAITEITPDNRKVRRQSTVTAICTTGLTLDQIRPVLEVYSSVGAGFLVVEPSPASAESIVDISHEALIRQWNLLGRWVEEESASRKALDLLERDAEAWKKLEDKKADANLAQDQRRAIRTRDYLYRGSRLQDAEKLSKRTDFAPARATVEFLQTSRTVENRRLRQARILLGGLVVAALALFVLLPAYYFNEQWKRTLEQAQQLETTQARAKAQAAVEQERDRLAAIVEQVCGKDTVRSGGTVCGELRKETSKPPATPRVYIQIGSEAQRPHAANCAKVLTSRGYSVQVFERVTRVPDTTSVRYFHPDDGAKAGEIAAALAQCQAEEPKNNLVKGFENVPAGQFEIWFSPTAEDLPDNRVAAQPGQAR